MVHKVLVLLTFIMLFSMVAGENLGEVSITNVDYYKKIAILIEWEENLHASSYVIYKKDVGNDFKRYDITEQTNYVDIFIEDNKEYSYKVAAVSKKGIEGVKTKEIVTYTKFYPKEAMDIYPRRFRLGDKITVYFSSKKSKEIKKYRKKNIQKDKNIKKEPEKIFIRYGYNDWDPEYFEKGGVEDLMVYDENLDYWKYEMVVPTYVRELDFAFRDELDNWDTNNNKDYKIRAIESNSGIYFVK